MAVKPDMSSQIYIPTVYKFITDGTILQTKDKFR